MEYMSDEQIFSIFCPECHLATLKANEQTIGYNKCSFCGFTEEDSQTDKRVKEWLKNINKGSEGF